MNSEKDGIGHAKIGLCRKVVQHGHSRVAPVEIGGHGHEKNFKNQGGMVVPGGMGWPCPISA